MTKKHKFVVYYKFMDKRFTDIIHLIKQSRSNEHISLEWLVLDEFQKLDWAVADILVLNKFLN